MKLVGAQRNSIGQRGQDVLISFLEEHFGYRFEAGERNGNIVNTELIEELEHCEFVPPVPLIKGPRLKFINKDGSPVILTMPDAFMSRNSSDSFYWIEIKTHGKYDNRIIIDKENFDDYAILYKYFTRQKFFVMCLNPIGIDDVADVYWCEMSSLLNIEPKTEIQYKNTVYVWQIEQVMKKLNKYPVRMNNYK